MDVLEFIEHEVSRTSAIKFAAAIGVSLPTVFSWLSMRRQPSYFALKRIANYKGGPIEVWPG